MKNLLSLKTLKKASWIIGLSLSALAVVNCTTDESIDIEKGNLLENTSSSDLSSKSVELGISGVTASAEQSANPAPNAIDNSSTSRWSGFGTGINLDLDLGSTANIDYIRVAFYKGNERRTSFRVFISSNRNNWTQINSKTSSGNTTSLETFDLSNSSARYLRLECNGNTNSNWNSITDVQVWGSGGEPSDNGGGDDDDDDDDNGGGSGSAAAIIGGMGSDWKLNAFSGSLNVGRGSYGEDGANGLDYEDRASTSDNNNWFFDTNGYASFKCHVGNPSSNGSGNMRSELRELDGRGDEISWDGTTNTNHRMRYKVQIRQLPSSGKVCFGQIHGEGNFDDVIRLQLEDLSVRDNDRENDNSGPGSGTYDVIIKGYVTETLDRDNRNRSWARMQMDREYDVEISMRNETVTVRLDGNTIYTSRDVDSDDNYFKAGAYLQSAQEDKDPQLRRNNSNFGEVWIKDLTVNH